MTRCLKRILVAVTAGAISGCGAGSTTPASSARPANRSLSSHPSLYPSLSLESVSTDGRTLTVTTLDSPCSLLSLVGVLENSQVVKLRLKDTTPPSASPPPPGVALCPAIGHLGRFAVTLTAPLGTRQLTSEVAPSG